jgi:hypothetical protein
MALNKLADAFPTTETDAWFVVPTAESWQPRRSTTANLEKRRYQEPLAAETMASRLRPAAKQEEPERRSLRTLLREIDPGPGGD